MAEHTKLEPLDAGLDPFNARMGAEEIIATMDRNEEAVAKLIAAENGCCSDKFAWSILVIMQNASQMLNAFKLGGLAIHQLAHGEDRHAEAVKYLRTALKIAEDLANHATSGIDQARVAETMRWLVEKEQTESKERLH